MTNQRAFRSTVADRAAVVGIGYSTISRSSGQTVDHLALTACKNAIEDAGLRADDVDAVISYHLNDSVSSDRVAEGLGLPGLTWYNDLAHGGDAAAASVAEAAMVVSSGIADVVVVYRALNGRSGYRVGKHGASAEASGTRQFLLPYGYVAPPQFLAMWCQRYMHTYSITAEQLAWVPLTARHNAEANERAVMRSPLTMDEYLASRFVAEPLRLYDCAVEVDGACAVVVTTVERARHLRHRPVFIGGFALGTGPKPDRDQWPAGYETMYADFVASTLWERSGTSPPDIDVAQFYDCFSHSVLCAIEGYGFCGKGEAGAFVEGGTRIARDGELPINTHGGLLSEGYLHGLNHSCEAVSQLRGDAGERQVAGAEVCLVTAGAGPLGGGIVYHV